MKQSVELYEAQKEIWNELDQILEDLDGSGIGEEMICQYQKRIQVLEAELRNNNDKIKDLADGSDVCDAVNIFNLGITYLDLIEVKIQSHAKIIENSAEIEFPNTHEDLHNENFRAEIIKNAKTSEVSTEIPKQKLADRYGNILNSNTEEEEVENAETTEEGTETSEEIEFPNTHEDLLNENFRVEIIKNAETSEEGTEIPKEKLADRHGNILNSNTEEEEVENAENTEEGLETSEENRSILNLNTEVDAEVEEREVRKPENGNKEKLFRRSVDNILNQPQANIKFAYSLRNLLNTTNKSLQELKAIDVQFDDNIVAGIVFNKLGREGQMLYKQRTGNSNDIPKLSDLMNFIEKQCKALQAIPIKTTWIHVVGFSIAMVLSIPYECYLCLTS